MIKMANEAVVKHDYPASFVVSSNKLVLIGDFLAWRN